jgi:hypothetical protein
VKLFKAVDNLADILGPNVSGIPRLSEVELHRHKIPGAKDLGRFDLVEQIHHLAGHVLLPVCGQICHENCGRQKLITSRLFGWEFQKLSRSLVEITRKTFEKSWVAR